MSAKKNKSKKPSDANSEPHEAYTFFIERTLGSKLIRGYLTERGVNVEIHGDHFIPDSPDEEWI